MSKWKEAGDKSEQTGGIGSEEDQLVNSSYAQNCLELHSERRVLTVKQEEQLRIPERGNCMLYAQKSVQN